MKKFYKNFLLAAAILAPAMAWAELKGTGTETDPYLLGTPEDMLEMRSVLVEGKITHFKMTADIDMGAVTTWAPLNTMTDESTLKEEGCTEDEIAKKLAQNSKVAFSKFIGFDGDGHVLKNLKCRADGANKDTYTEARGWYYKSIFGVLAGYCRNTSFEGCVMVDGKMGGGLLGGYIGHPNYEAAGYKETVVENCYFNCTVKETANKYCGGLFGTNGSNAIIRNCNVQISVFGTNGGMTGGIIGRLSNSLTVENIVIPYGKQVNALNYGGGLADSMAKYAQDYKDGKELPSPAVGILFAARSGDKAKVTIKNIVAVYQYLFGSFIADGEARPTPFGPLDATADNIDAEVLGSFKTSPWTQSADKAVLNDNGGWDVGTKVNLMDNFKQYCYGGNMEVNYIYRSMTVGQEMTCGNIGLAYYPIPRWLAGRTYYAGGIGSEENPYLISNTTQLLNMWRATNPSYAANFKLTDDIDFGAGVKCEHMAPLGYDGLNYSWILNFDGNFKTISNFTPNPDIEKTNDQYGTKNVYYHSSLFGILNGHIKNLGIINPYVVGKDRSADGGLVDGAGVIAVYAGHSDDRTGNGALIENCYVEGGAARAGNYAGGLVGTSTGKCVIKNCWSSAAVQAPLAGGLVGRVDDAPMTIENCVSRPQELRIDGDAETSMAGGIAVVRKGTQETFKVSNVISWGDAINGEGQTSATICPEGLSSNTNVLVWNGLRVNGASVSNGTTAAELLKVAQKWPAWSADKNNNGYPMIKWEAGEPQQSGVEGVLANKEVVAKGGEGVIYVNGASVVYNMAGQVVYAGNEEVVSVPAGLYIVKVAGNASKVAVK